MASASSQYQRLIRLREKRKRLDARISQLERKLEGKKYYFGNCSRNRKRA